MGLKIEAGKYYRTRDGRKACVAMRNKDGDWVAVVDGYHNLEVWDDYGVPCEGSNTTSLTADWVELKRIRGWLNVYDEDYQGDFHTGYIFASRQRADSQIHSMRRIACIEIDVLEGTGLDGEAGR